MYNGCHQANHSSLSFNMDTLFYKPYKTYKFFTSMITFLYTLQLNFYLR